MKRIELIIKNLLLRLLLVIYHAPKSNDKLVLTPNTKILFIRLNRIGDALVTTPLISAVKKSSNCQIHILGDKKNHFVFRNNPSIDLVHVFNKGVKGLLEFRKLVKLEKYDVIIDLHDDVSTTVSFLIALSGVQNRFALRKENYKIYSDTVQKLDPAKYHVIDRLMVLAELLSITYSKDEINVIYNPLPESVSKVNQFILEKFNTPNYLVGINISAGSHARFWGVERFKSVIEYFQKYNVSIVIIAAEKDVEFASQISEGKIPIFCDPDFDKFAAFISKLNFLFTPDTSIVHLASAYNIPLFGLYVKYNTANVIWYPYKSDYDCVVTEEPNFQNLEFENVKDKFFIFFEQQYKSHFSKLN